MRRAEALSRFRCSIDSDTACPYSRSYGWFPGRRFSAREAKGNATAGIQTGTANRSRPRDCRAARVFRPARAPVTDGGSQRANGPKRGLNRKSHWRAARSAGAGRLYHLRIVLPFAPHPPPGRQGRSAGASFAPRPASQETCQPCRASGPHLLKGEAPLVASTEVVVATLSTNGISGSRECAHRAIPSREGRFALGGRPAPAFRGARFRLHGCCGFAPVLDGGR